MADFSAAVSNVGRVRSSNQDSGYAGTFLTVVADGMGGHAGGDVASHLAVRQMLELDKEFADAETAREALFVTLHQTNDLLSSVVFDHPELAGLGTTVSAMVRVGEKMVIAHIGDSRIYLLREGNLSQVTVDHTFVQRLIDSGRITEEESYDHPRRSVLMRVLGDVDAAPEIDTMVLDIQPGDIWMLCSDGLTGVVMKSELQKILSQKGSAEVLAEALVQSSLDGGAPDNVTAAVVQISEIAPEPNSQLVGSVAGPMPLKEPSARNTNNLGPRPKPRALPVNTGGLDVPAPALTAQLDAVKARRIRRRIVLAVSLAVVIIAIVVAGNAGYRWTQTQYFVGADADSVVIYQGIPQTVGSFQLSEPFQDTDIPLDTLTDYWRAKVTATIHADSLQDAQNIVTSLTQGQVK